MEELVAVMLAPPSCFVHIELNRTQSPILD